jgi:hypothetical protein
MKKQIYWTCVLLDGWNQMCGTIISKAITRRKLLYHPLQALCMAWPLRLTTRKCMNKSYWLSTGEFLITQCLKTFNWQPKLFIYTFSCHELQWTSGCRRLDQLWELHVMPFMLRATVEGINLHCMPCHTTCGLHVLV